MQDAAARTPRYVARRPSADEFVPLRGLRYRVHRWGDASLVRADRPPLVMLHGWMDVGASFQFVVDALAAVEGFERLIFAPDWRGFGRTEVPPTDSYWFPDYLADLDAVLDALAPATAVDLLGHSMGGNVAMTYAGVRPERVHRLVNLEGFGQPATHPRQAPQRLRQWLDALKRPPSLRDYASLEEVAQRLMANNPLLTPDKAAWLAPHWAAPGTGGRYRVLGDPAHKIVNPYLYRVEEVLETWKRIAAPVLWVEGDRTDTTQWWGDRYPRGEFDARIGVVQNLQKHTLSPAGHMLHHDQPEALARRLARYLISE